ncbi:hypothetical protein H257_10652 [Aphanomyces astaci]|uniref:Uncharacterized protein n=1 Tax=Aphanomyces astaci TaxID=112090 RepID=W4G5S7_APHAT|nr:hypothetical protein H257_10652 [Aphanomyces astaci]ETV75052.1 hypothetical protein H257_10652 [Aphanomyces astaci]|eukprot:XP_009835556.1 hypothetical protein H257_10652 [Aphanomyces astaci]
MTGMAMERHPFDALTWPEFKGLHVVVDGGSECMQGGLYSHTGNIMANIQAGSAVIVQPSELSIDCFGVGDKVKLQPAHRRVIGCLVAVVATSSPVGLKKWGYVVHHTG